MNTAPLRRPDEVSARQFAMFIDGQWVASQSGQRFACVDPYTEESWGSVPRANAEDVDSAVARGTLPQLSSV